MNNAFSDYQKIAESFGFLTEHRKGNQDNPMEELLIILPGENKQVLHLRIDQDVFGFPLSNAKASLESFIHIYSFLPLTIAPDSIPDAARLMNFINKSLDAPGFILDEVNLIVLYRTVFFKPGEILNENTFMSLIGLISLYIDTFSPLIERVGKGENLDSVLGSELESLAS